jgi:hypothetical protein
MYWFKLNHIAKDKISFRGTGPYSVKTSQPLGGKSRKGGQRLGEMEIWAIIAHGDEVNLHEFISTKSDSVKLRNKYISEQMCNSDLLLDSDDDEVPQSLRLLQADLKSIGLDYELNDGTVHVDDTPEIIEDVEVTDECCDDVIIDPTPEPIIDDVAFGGFEIGAPNWGDKKITYDVSDPDAIPDVMETILGDDDVMETMLGDEDVERIDNGTDK